MSKKSWYVPTATMKETNRQKKKRDKRFDGRKKNDTMYHCKVCGIVYKKATFMYNQYRKDCKEEYYPRDVMPTYGLEKKDCLKCK